MSTFYGGEQLLSVTLETATSAASFTLPSGRYAKVELVENSISGTNITVGSSIINLTSNVSVIGGTLSVGDVGLNSIPLMKYTLLAGEKVEINIGQVQFYLYQYKQP